MTRRYMLLILAVFMLQACASTDALSRQMSGWQSQRAETAIAEWGEPEERLALGDQTLLVWRDRLGNPADYGDGGQAVAVLCERQLAVDASGVITGWRWRGDSCPAIQDFGSHPAFFAATPK